MQKGEQGLSPLEFFKQYGFWHHTLLFFFLVDLAVELASNWNGVKALRNLVPVEDLTYAFMHYPSLYLLYFLTQRESPNVLIFVFATSAYVLCLFVCDFFLPESVSCMFEVAEFSFTN